LTPADQIAATPAQYPPALTGLRGQHPGSFEVAHAFAREGQRFGIDNAPSEENYNLVVVGGGISGLAAAWFYRRAVGAGPAFSFSTITTISAATPSATNSQSRRAR
jgi:spermidine dehydrogenase